MHGADTGNKAPADLTWKKGALRSWPPNKRGGGELLLPAACSRLRSPLGSVLGQRPGPAHPAWPHDSFVVLVDYFAHSLLLVFLPLHSFRDDAIVHLLRVRNPDQSRLLSPSGL